MSIIKEILESNNFIKAKALLIFLVPFWYISIYLFKYDFYSRQDLLLTICMCTVISLMQAITLGSIISYISLIHNADKDVKEDNDHSEYFEEMTASVVFLCTWLSILIFASYTVCHFYNCCIDFYWYLVLSFTPHFLMSLLALFAKKIKRESKRLAAENELMRKKLDEMRNSER